VKKCSVLICALILLSSTVLAGCGGTSKDTSAPASSQPSVNTQVSKEDTISELFAKGQKLEGISYDCVVSNNGKTTMTGKFWLQGNKMKYDVTVEGQNMITLIDGDSFIGYNPNEKVAYKITVDKANQAKTPNDYLQEANSQIDKYKSLETTLYDGAMCRVISVTGPDGKELTKMWVREDYGIPVKVETVGSDGSISVLEYKNVKIGAIPDSTFKLPDGVQVTDINDLTKQIPQISIPKGN
jgi:outer membrane lipoprotein-sorting protein